MKKSYRISFIFILAIFLYTPRLTLAFEIILHDQGPEVVRSKQVAIIFPRATSEDVVCGKYHHMTRFQLNSKHAGLPFSISAKKMTRIKIRWDHPDKVLFPFAEREKTIVFPHAGGESRFYLRAYKPISGNLYIMDDKDVVIKTCPYSFLPVKRYRQSINVDLNETEYDYQNSTLENENNNLSINYRVSSKTSIPDGPTWSWSAGLSKSDSSVDSERVNSSFSFNW